MCLARRLPQAARSCLPILWSARRLEQPAQFGNMAVPQGATLAQLVEQLIRNQQVAGSTPAGGSKKSSKINSL